MLRITILFSWLFAGSFGNETAPVTYDVNVFATSQAPAHLNAPMVLIGDGHVQLQESAHIYGLIPENSNCANTTSNFHVHAIGTFFKGIPVLHDFSSNFSISDLSCAACPAALITNQAINNGASVYVGGLTQVYRLDVQTLIACFQQQWPPYFGAGLGWVVGLVASHARKHARPLASSCFQTATATSLIGEGVQKAYEAYSLKALEGSVDVCKLISIATAIIAGMYVMYTKCSYVSYYPGDKKTNYTVKSMISAIVIFLVSASFAAASPISQATRALCESTTTTQEPTPDKNITYNVRRP